MPYKILPGLNIKWLLLLYTLFLFILHIIPTGAVALNQMEVGTFRADYLLHTAIFLPWMLLVAVRVKSFDEVNRHNRNIDGIIQAAKWIGLGLIVAITAEGIQYWLPWRSFNPMDVLFNCLGIIIGSLFFVFSPNQLKNINFLNKRGT